MCVCVCVDGVMRMMMMIHPKALVIPPPPKFKVVLYDALNFSPLCVHAVV